MSYHDLSECTLTPDERLAEAGRIVEILAPYMDKLSDREISFVEGMERACSVKQLFWLRDILARVQ